MQPAELFRFCPRCGAARSPDNEGAIPFRCGACRFVYYFNPTVAAAAFVFDDQNRVLFIRRAREPSQGKLGLPGGFVDMGESAEQGLRREIREEVGLEVECVEFLVSHPNLYPYREVIYPVVDLYFTAKAVNPEAAQPLDAVAGIEWRDPTGVPEAEVAFESLQVAMIALLMSSRTQAGGG